MNEVREGIQQRVARENAAQAREITGRGGPLGHGNFLAAGRGESPFPNANVLATRARTAGTLSFRRAVPVVDRGFAGAVVLRGGNTHDAGNLARPMEAKGSKDEPGTGDGATGKRQERREGTSKEGPRTRRAGSPGAIPGGEVLKDGLPRVDLGLRLGIQRVLSGEQEVWSRFGRWNVDNSFGPNILNLSFKDGDQQLMSYSFAVEQNEGSDIELVNLHRQVMGDRRRGIGTASLTSLEAVLTVIAHTSERDITLTFPVTNQDDTAAWLRKNGYQERQVEEQTQFFKKIQGNK